MTYSEEEITKMRLTAIEQGLDGPALFWNGDMERLVSVLNGCGAEWMSDKAVDALTWVFRKYQETVAIHDCRYALAGKEGTQEEADREFRENGLKQWACEYGSLRWLNPVAWVGRHKIIIAYDALRITGKKAWEEAKTKGACKNDNG